jgi:hypothetical protein
MVTFFEASQWDRTLGLHWPIRRVILLLGVDRDGLGGESQCGFYYDAPHDKGEASRRPTL